jgi:hypothetical protein
VRAPSRQPSSEKDQKDQQGKNESPNNSKAVECD